MAGNVVQFLRLPVLASSGLAVLASGMLYFKQKYVSVQFSIELRLTIRVFSELIYPRNIPVGSRTDVPKPPDFDMADWEDIRFKTRDGEQLAAYLIRPTNKRAASDITVLMFHGNAGNIGHRLPIASMLERSLHCNVLMVEYRGYGLSTGTPDEHGIKIDAQTALDWVRNRDELKGTKIIVYGQSLGGAVSTWLTAKNQKQGDIKGLILENTFMSIRKLIPRFAHLLQ